MADVPPSAVFLSYASQDAEAARRICEALRSGGVNVWFDADGGLEHGDEWDAKIRRQIKECVLFLPIISANTQAREEGYFRLEWDLAAERARTIASGVPFILPVVIDDTREPDALVPDRFRTVQWTKLPGGVVTPDVKARYLKLWSHRIGVAKGMSTEPARAALGGRSEGVVPAATPAPKGRLTGWAIAGAAVLAVVAGFVALQPKPSPAPAVATAPVAPVSEARLRVQKARTLMSDVNASRTNFDAAHERLAQAVKLDPNDASAWSAWAELDYLYRYWGMDRTEERMSEARRKAQRALALDPESRDALYAHAVSLVFGPNAMRQAPEVEATLQRLLQRNPADAAALILMGHHVLWRSLAARLDEALGYYARAARVPAFTRQAEEAAGLANYLGLRFQAAEEKFDQLLAQEKTWQALRLKALIALEWRGDLDAAKQALEALPSSLLLEDFFVGVAFNVYRSRRDHTRLIEIFRAITSDFIFSNVLSGPRALFLGEALEWAGRPDAAILAYNEALQAVDRRLAEKSGEPLYVGWRAIVLARLGRLDDARKALDLAAQVYDGNLPVFHSWLRTYAQIGRTDDALAALEKQFDDPQRPPHVFTAAVLRLEPNLDLLRSHPRFQALLAKVEADPRFSPTARKAGTAPDTKSVAVLPFVNQSADKDNEFFSDGIAEELLTVLRNIPGLRVAARTSAWSFKGRNPTAKEVGEKLGMAHVVEGSVQKFGNKMKITARLSRAATNEEVWSRSFGPLEPTDLFATQSELAAAIATELRGRLTGDSSGVAATEMVALVQTAQIGGTKNVEAHELYLRSKFLTNQFSLESFARAQALLQQAVERDPNFAMAWALLAQVGRLRSGWGNTRYEVEAGYALSERASVRAVDLAPNLPEAHLARVNFQLIAFDWKGARASVRRLLELAPTTALESEMRLATALGERERAVAAGRQAVAADPVNPELRVNFAFALVNARRLEDAEAEFRRAVEMSVASPVGYAGIALVKLLQGKAGEAAAAASREGSGWARTQAIALARWGEGDRAAADAALAELSEREGDVAAYQVAQVYGFRGDADNAFRWLERALRQRDPGLTFCGSEILFESLHRDPRWPTFLRKIGLHAEQLRELR